MFSKKLSVSALTLAMASAFSPAMAAGDTVRIGLMLPYTGTYAHLGDSVTKGLKQFVRENNGMIGGKKVEFFTVDDASDVTKAEENVKKLYNRDKVDVVIGTVHSGVTLKMAEVARSQKKLLIIPVAGAEDLTAKLCSPYIFRTSYSNWQLSYSTGVMVAKKGLKNIAMLTWDYSYGNESFDAFKEGLGKSGKIVKEIKLKFPDVDFASSLKDIEASNPDAVFVALGGAGAAKFATDYNQSKLGTKTPLYSNGNLTEGNLFSIGGPKGPEGILTTFPYADDLKNEKNIKFRQNFITSYKTNPDTFSVTGYDLGQLYNEGLKAAGGDPKNLAAIIKGIEKATIESPRGPFSLNKGHNPIQHLYLRQAKDNMNIVVDIAPNLVDPATDCNM